MRTMELNSDAWKLAAKAMFRNGKKWECISKGKLREMLMAVQEGKVKELRAIADDYSPPERPFGRARGFKALANEVITKLQRYTNDQDAQKETLYLLKYTLWNVYTLERLQKDLRDPEGMRRELTILLRGEGQDMTLVDEVMATYEKCFGQNRRGPNNRPQHSRDRSSRDFKGNRDIQRGQYRR